MSDTDDPSDTDSADVNAAGLSRLDSYHNPPAPEVGPYLEITEEPQSRGFRFRYACEGKSHGGIQGVSSRREKKSYPTVRINRYKGPAKITVSLVTDDKLPKPHAHELIGKNCANGTCSVAIKGDSMTVSFPNLGVRHVTRKSVHKILTDRISEMMKVDKMMNGELGQDADHIKLTSDEESFAMKQALVQAKDMPLSVVRLRFQAYLQDHNGHYSTVLAPVLSNPIFDSKAPCASLLKICRMDKIGGCCTGNEEIFLLCDKVQKDDVAVRFFEQDDDGNIKWEDYGNFAPHDVHRQYAVVFRTPPYWCTTLDRPVIVLVQLKRFSDGEVSDPKTFTYYPQHSDLEDIQRKRRKQLPNFGDDQSFGSNTDPDNNNEGSFNGNTQGSESYENINWQNSNGNNGYSNYSLPTATDAEAFNSSEPLSLNLTATVITCISPLPSFLTSQRLETDVELDEKLSSDRVTDASILARLGSNEVLAVTANSGIVNVVYNDSKLIHHGNPVPLEELNASEELENSWNYCVVMDDNKIQSGNEGKEIITDESRTGRQPFTNLSQ